MYLEIKILHMTAALLSIGGFFIRGLWMMADSALLQRRWVKIAPHVIDTLFLLSGLTLMFYVHQYPFVHDWLTAKVLGLIAYIVVGTIALKRGPTKGIRIVAWLAALMIFAYIVGVARTHNVMSWLA